MLVDPPVVVPGPGIDGTGVASISLVGPALLGVERARIVVRGAAGAPFALLGDALADVDGTGSLRFDLPLASTAAPCALDVYALLPGGDPARPALLAAAHLLVLPADAAAEVAALFQEMRSEVGRFFEAAAAAAGAPRLGGAPPDGGGGGAPAPQPAAAGAAPDPAACYAHGHFFAPFAAAWAALLRRGPRGGDALTTYRRLLGYLLERDMYCCSVLLMDEEPELARLAVSLGLEVPVGGGLPPVLAAALPAAPRPGGGGAPPGGAQRPRGAGAAGAAQQEELDQRYTGELTMAFLHGRAAAAAAAAPRERRGAAQADVERWLEAQHVVAVGGPAGAPAVENGPGAACWDAPQAAAAGSDASGEAAGPDPWGAAGAEKPPSPPVPPAAAAPPPAPRAALLRAAALGFRDPAAEACYAAFKAHFSQTADWTAAVYLLSTQLLCLAKSAAAPTQLAVVAVFAALLLAPYALMVARRAAFMRAREPLLCASRVLSGALAGAVCWRLPGAIPSVWLRMFAHTRALQLSHAVILPACQPVRARYAAPARLAALAADATMLATAMPARAALAHSGLIQALDLAVTLAIELWARRVFLAHHGAAAAQPPRAAPAKAAAAAAAPAAARPSAGGARGHGAAKED
ncbi:MAG: hypothetical protein J3K34DRAFT_525985 [Monoraphidium minutum]|nr:MAG: hypothetical protein J3K34DRAFT_525985 [Monoraphidium minutum]